MLIAETARRSGLTEDTIRFYEKSGMLPPIARDRRGWRVFSKDDLDWLMTLERLRVTGMPLDDVKRFAVSAFGADQDTAEQRAIRLSLLETHAVNLARQRKALDACDAFLTHKISIYRSYLKE